MEKKKQANNYVMETIGQFRKNIIKSKDEIVYEFKEDEYQIIMKIDKKHYNQITTELKKADIDFEVIPAEKKLEIKYPRYNGKKFLKTKPFKIVVYFVDIEKMLEKKKNKDSKVSSWSEFFEVIEPEYKNLFKKIVDNITIAVFKDEYNNIISKKTYYLDFNDGLFERKEKLINGEWVIMYQPVTSNLTQVFRMFFKFFEQVPIDELTSFEKFKEIVSKTKYKNYIKN